MIIQEASRSCLQQNLIKHHEAAIQLMKHHDESQSQNRDLWFTLSPQRSLLVSWLFLAIPILLLKFSIFYYTSIIIIIHIIIIIILSPLYSLSLPFFLKKNYTALLTESFRVSVTYLQMHTRQIANQSSLENFLSSSSPLHWRSSVYWRSCLRIKLRAGILFS